MTLIPETNNTTQNPVENNTANGAENNGSAPVNQEPNKQQAEIDVNLKEKPKEKIMMNFGKGFNSQGLFSKTTETEKKQVQDTAQPQAAQVVKTDLQKLGEPISTAQYTETTDPAYFNDIAEGIIWAVDMLVTWLLSMFSKDPNSKISEYKVGKEKLDRLKECMAKILMHMKKKFPLGWTFFIMMIAAYAGAFTSALQKRMEINKLEEAEKKRKKLEEKKQPDNLTTSVRKNVSNGNTQTVKYTEIKVPEKTQEREVPVVTTQEEPIKQTKKTVTVSPSANVRGINTQRKSSIVVPNKKKDDMPIIPKKTGRGGMKKH